MASLSGPVLTQSSAAVPMPASPPRPQCQARYAAYAQQKVDAQSVNKFTSALGSITPQSWMHTTPDGLAALMKIVDAQRTKLLHSVGCPAPDQLAKLDLRQISSVRNLLVQIVANQKSSQAAPAAHYLEETPRWRFVDEKDHYVSPTFILSFSSAAGRLAFLEKAKQSGVPCAVHNFDVYVSPSYSGTPQEVVASLEKLFGPGFREKQVGGKFVFDDCTEEYNLHKYYPAIFTKDVTISQLASLDVDRLEVLLKIFNDALPQALRYS